ncbi:MAG: T9SS type A sorting domain-containing protein [Cyclobacteriaceae bacterium]
MKKSTLLLAAFATTSLSYAQLNDVTDAVITTGSDSVWVSDMVAVAGTPISSLQSGDFAPTGGSFAVGGSDAVGEGAEFTLTVGTVTGDSKDTPVDTVEISSILVNYSAGSSDPANTTGGTAKLELNGDSVGVVDLPTTGGSTAFSLVSITLASSIKVIEGESPVFTLSMLTFNQGVGGANAGLRIDGFILNYSPTVIANSGSSLDESDVVAIYPNPSNGTINVDLDKLTTTQSTINIYSYTGNLVYTSVGSGLVELSTDLDAGQYLMQIITDKQNYSKKIVIE